MSLPGSLSSAFGLALIRKPAGAPTSAYEFVDWYSGPFDIAYDAPGTGTWDYVVAIVIGAGGLATSISYEGKATLLAEVRKR